MEDEFIMDFEIEEDPIKKFLLHKLEEIKLNNAELEHQIANRKQMLDECVNKMAKEFTANALNFVGMWQKILNDKLVLGIKVENISKSGSVDNINVILKWDSPNSLTYTTKIFGRYKNPTTAKSIHPDKLAKLIKMMEHNKDNSNQPADNEWIQIDEINQDGVIVVAFSLPECAEKSRYNFSAITYQYKQAPRQLKIDDFDISRTNLFSNLLAVKNWDIINGNAEAYLATLVANEESDFYVKSDPHFYINIENMLEFECRFKKVDILAKNRKYFYVDGVNSLINSSFLVIEKINEFFYTLNVFTSNSTTKKNLLHYLHENIPNVTISPIKYKSSGQEALITLQGTQSDSIVSKDKLLEFGKCLERQIEFVEEFYKTRLDRVDEKLLVPDEIKLDVSAEDYRKFRNELAGLELEGDLIYSEIEPLKQKVELLSQIQP